MSKSHRDQKGKRINGEIWGRGCIKVINDKVFPACGGEHVGSPNQKRWAKTMASKMRRRDSKTVCVKASSKCEDEVAQLC